MAPCCSCWCFLQQNLENPGVASAENSILRDSYLWEEWESLQRDKRHFKLQKGHLEAEKKNITDARVMLEKQVKCHMSTIYLLICFEGNVQSRYNKVCYNDNVLKKAVNLNRSPYYNDMKCTHEMCFLTNSTCGRLGQSLCFCFLQRREFEADKACDLKHSFLHLTPFHGKSQRPRSKYMYPFTHLYCNLLCSICTTHVSWSIFITMRRMFC